MITFDRKHYREFRTRLRNEIAFGPWVDVVRICHWPGLSQKDTAYWLEYARPRHQAVLAKNCTWLTQEQIIKATALEHSQFRACVTCKWFADKKGHYCNFDEVKLDTSFIREEGRCLSWLGLSKPIEEINNVQLYNELNLLNQADKSLSGNDFDQIFGQDGPHLWAKFQNVNYSVVRLWGEVDENQRAILVNHLSERQRQQRQAESVSPTLPTFKVTMSRSFAVTVRAEDEDKAKEFAEFYLGYHDCSTPADRKQHNFLIDEIKMTEEHLGLNMGHLIKS